MREAQPEDLPGLMALLRAAFGGETEAGLVARLMASPADVALCLVAAAEETPCGMVLFSRMSLDGAGPPAGGALALAPLAVAPARQRQGIGSALVREGLALCRARALAPAVLVLGEPGTYGRFGFSAALAAGVAGLPWSGHPAFQALALRPSFVPRGEARYAAAFDPLTRDPPRDPLTRKDPPCP
jgi:putative acetyltransferase